MQISTIRQSRVYIPLTVSAFKPSDTAIINPGRRIVYIFLFVSLPLYICLKSHLQTKLFHFRNKDLYHLDKLEQY